MFLPENIDLSQPENYTLTVRIKPDGWSFAIKENNLGGGYCYRENSFSKDTNVLSNIQRMIFDFNFLSQNFHRTDIIFVSNEYEFVPEYLFEKKKTIDLYNLSHNKKTNRILLSHEKRLLNFLLFSVENEIYQFLSRSLFNPSFWHHTDLILNYVSKKNQTKNDTAKMYLNFHDNFVDIYCFDKQSNFLHAITYYNESAPNIIYHILNIWDKCKFDQNRDFLFFITPESEKDKKVQETIKDYIKNIERIGLPSEIDFFGEDGHITPLDVITLLLK